MKMVSFLFGQGLEISCRCSSTRERNRCPAIPYSSSSPTFEIIASKADAFATDFYRRLFALHPEIELLFVRVEMTTMRMMLVRMFGVTVRGLHNLPKILPDLRALGMRHSSYGVRAKHFDFAEDALLHALTVHLGEAFCPEVRQGWRDVFGLIRRAMLSGFAEDSSEVLMAKSAIPLSARSMASLLGVTTRK